MSEIILESRINPPRISGNILHRKRLNDLLKQNEQQSLILICAQAGCGKTTLVNDFLTGNKRKSGWFYVSEDVTSFYTFAAYTITALGKLNEDFGKNTIQLIELDKQETQGKIAERNVQNILISFLSEFSRVFTEDITLVFDDIHNLESSAGNIWSDVFFDFLFENLPSNLHVIITSRTKPSFNTIKLAAKRRILNLSTADLLFTEDELSDFLAEFYEVNSLSDIRSLNLKIKGWITGIHLVMQSNPVSLTKLAAGSSTAYESIFDYFASDIFENLDAKYKQFLTATAFLDSFNPEICNYILESENSSEVIEELIRRNIFIESINAEQREFTYRELFREFLLNKLSKSGDHEELSMAYSKICSYFISRNDFRNVVIYSLRNKNYSISAEYFRKVFQEEYSAGNYEILWKWLSAIPDDLVKADVILMFCKAKLKFFYLFDSGETVRLTEYIISNPGNAESKLICEIYLLKAEALYLLGKIDEIYKLIEVLLGTGSGDKIRVRALLLKAKADYRMGPEYYSGGISSLEQALEICSNNDIPELKKDIYQYLGLIYRSKESDILKALHYFELSLSLAPEISKDFSTILNICNVHTFAGSYDKAKEYFDRAYELYTKYPSVSFERNLLRKNAYFRYEAGDFEQSIDDYNKATRLDKSSNINAYIPYYYLMIGDSYSLINKDNEAVHYLSLAMNEAKESGNKENEIIISYLLAIVSKKSKVSSDIESKITEFLKLNEEGHYVIAVVQGKFHLADFYLKSGMTDSAANSLADCLKVSSEKQFINFLENEVYQSRHLFDFALENNIQKQFVKTILGAARNKLSYSWLSEACQNRLTGKIQTLTDLKLTSFGKTEIQLRGEPIKEEKWIRKKSKIILTYLLAKPDSVLNKNKIIDIFFQDVPLDTVDTVYHNALSNIRNAVKIDAMKKFTAGSNDLKKKSSYEIIPQFIIYEDKNLSLNKDYHFESDNTEFEFLFNVAMSSGIKVSAKIENSIKAVNLYKGEFMPGYYENWCEELRQSYSNKYQKLCEELMEFYFVKENNEQILNYSEKLIELDKLHAEAYVHAIESLVKSGKTNSAKAMFAKMLKNYEEELGEKPGRAVLGRISEILSDS